MNRCCMGSRRHYLPQFLLKQFRGSSGLWEWDKQTDIVERRNVENAGQFPDFYPPEIERGVMETWDNDAARICRDKVFGKDQIVLTPEQRGRLGVWLGLFFVRIPDNLRQAQRYTAGFGAEDLVADLRRSPHIALQDFRLWLRDQGQWAIPLLGTVGAYLHFLQMAERSIRDNPERFVPLPESVFHHHIGTKDFEWYGEFLAGLTWTWVRTEGRFVVGDSAIARWHVPTGKPNAGITAEDVELTVPLTQSVCLLMRKRQAGGGPDAGHVTIDTARTAELNTRQIESAVRMVYGPSPGLLKPDEYGFDASEP